MDFFGYITGRYIFCVEFSLIEVFTVNNSPFPSFFEPHYYEN